VVYDFARDEDGRVVAIGRFQWKGRQQIDPLVRLDGDKWVSATDDWSRDAPEIGFSAIAISEEGVMALSTNSGPFGAVPPEIWLVSRDEIHVIGQLLGSVRSLIWFDGKLWAAGFFHMEEGGVNHLAVWDGTAWSAPPGGPADRAVYRLTASGNSLLLAGDFSSVGGIPARGIAEWDGETWQAYDLGPETNPAHVYAVARSESGDLYAGGAISGGVLRWDGTGWEQLNGGVFARDFSGVVTDFTLHKGALYITGCFSHLGGPESDPTATPAASVAKWTGSVWESLDDGSQPVGTSWFEYGVCGSEPNAFTIWDVRHQRLFSNGERVFLGGMMPGVGGVPSQSIASYDGQDWKGYGETNRGLFGASRSIAIGGPSQSVYIMGSTTHAAKVQADSGIYRYDNGNWQPLGGRLPADLTCTDFAVSPLGMVFVGCNTPIQLELQPAQPVVLQLVEDEWVPLESFERDGTVWDMQFDSRGRLWIVGGIRIEDSAGSGFVARWDGGKFTIVEDGFNSMVFQIAFPPEASMSGSEEFIAAGAFTQIDGSNFARIARFREGQWEPLGTELNTAVLALAWAEDAVYASTETPPQFNEAPPRPFGPDAAPALTRQSQETKRMVLGRWNGTHWTELGTAENGLPAPREETVHDFRDLLTVGKYLIAVGSVWPETGGRNVFVYDGQQLKPLRGGVNAISVESVGLANDGLWFGGFIAEAGSGDERIPSVGVARFAVDDEIRKESRLPPRSR
jgi:hypothetical protein